MKINHMKTIIATFTLTTICLQGAVIVGTDTQGLASYTTGDSLVTLTPFGKDGATSSLLNNGTGFIGVNSVGLDSNAENNGVRDTDGNPATTADQERLTIAFAPTAGLSGIAFAFSRANGPAATDGIQISGFLSDPGITLSGGAFVDVRWDAGRSSVFAELSGAQFDGTDRIISFSNLGASAGQTLTLTSNDSDEPNPQAAIRNISYETIPEPSSLVLLGLSAAGLIFRRQK